MIADAHGAEEDPPTPDADSLPNWLPGGVGGGWGVSEAVEGFVTSPVAALAHACEEALLVASWSVVVRFNAYNFCYRRLGRKKRQTRRERLERRRGAQPHDCRFLGCVRVRRCIHRSIQHC